MIGSSSLRNDSPTVTSRWNTEYQVYGSGPLHCRATLPSPATARRSVGVAVGRAYDDVAVAAALGGLLPPEFDAVTVNE